MLHIDYSTIPLTDEDRGAIRAIVLERIAAGRLPAVQKSHHGRVAVVNPDAVQTVHHVPDALRTPLRRTLHPTAEGTLQIAADRIFKTVAEDEGPLYVLILELESPFKHLGDFLDHLPRLRARHPDMAVFVAGTQPMLMDLLQSSMASAGAKLRFGFADARGSIEITDAAELTQVRGEPREPPSFSLPFFSQIRLVLAEGQPPIAFNLDTLRKLHGHFGTGEVKEIDMGGGRVEKVMIIDLPTRVIKDFQFRQDRGLDFHGILRGGLEIPSRNFEREKLEHRWVPLDGVDAFLKRVPGKDVEKIELKKVKAFRINTFNGNISFVANQSADQISIEEAESVTLVRNAPAGAPEAGKPQEIRLDRLIIGKGGASFDRLHEEIKLHFYGRLMSGEEEQRIKLERYTRRLTVGSVGPLAGHTLKLLRRYGLERLIDPASFHYLCDTTAQLPEHHLIAQRFEETFQSMIKLLREIAAVAGTTKLRLDDITHKMPVITQWLDMESIGLNDVAPTDLETAYREMRILIGFIDHEFQRQFEVGSEDLAFFQKIEKCQGASLLSKWLADYKRGAYGTALPQGAHPDLLFLATAKDKTANDERFFLPALVCSDFFADPGNKSLFERGDYQFPVFLESHLALAEHAARQEGETQPSLATVEKYFDEQAAKLDDRLSELEASAGHIDMSGSPEYQSLMRQEEEAYHERYRQFLQEKEGVHQRLSEAEQGFQTLLLDIAPRLRLPPDPHPAWLKGAEPDPGIFSQEFLLAARQTLRGIQAQSSQAAGAIAKQLAARASALKDFGGILAGLLQAHQRWMSAETLSGFGGVIEQVNQTLPARLAALKKQDDKTREAYQQRIVSQSASADSELEQSQAKEELRRNRGTQAVRALQSGAERLAAQCAGMTPGAIEHPGQLKAELARTGALAKRVGDMARTLGENAAKLGEELTQHGQALIRLRQAAIQAHKLKAELAALNALAAKAEPMPPEPPRLIALGAEAGAGAAAAGTEALQQAFQQRNQEVAAWGKKLQLLAQPPPELKQGHDLLEGFEKLRERKNQLEKFASHKDRLRRSVAAIDERIQIMDRELADLPRRVEEKFMPARKELLVQVFVPEARRERDYARQAKSFVRELSGQNMEAIKRLYLDRAVFRRFASRQFLRGAQIANDPASPLVRKLYNLQPAINKFVQQLEFNYQKRNPLQAAQAKLEYSRPLDPARIWSFVQQLHGQGASPRFGYVVLPGTLPVDQAVRMMNQKDQLYNGLPTLVLVYLSKFDPDILRTDNALRDAYFRALKHNVVLNIDNRLLVDNPVAMAERLAEETLGSAWDVEKLESLPEDENA